MAERPSRQVPGPRLAVIEGLAGRRSAIPFALLILAVLGAGLVALLMLNTAMDENSVKMQQAEKTQAALTDREQQLSQQLAGLSAPGALASAAAAQGLVPNPQPAFINPSNGAVIGTPSAAPSPSPPPAPSPAASPTGSAGPTAGASAGPSGTPGGTASPASPAANRGTASAASSPAPSASGSKR